MSAFSHSLPLTGWLFWPKCPAFAPSPSSLNCLSMARPTCLTMPSRILACLAATSGGLLVSCSPYPENPPYRATPRTRPMPARIAPAPVVTAPAAKSDPNIHAQAAKPATAVTARPLPPAAVHPTPTPPPRQSPTQPQSAATLENPPAAASPDLPVATAAPGKPGYVLSPYNHKLILVRTIPSGTVVPDPGYPASDKKFFRVP